jgi:hypothetical protein
MDMVQFKVKTLIPTLVHIVGKNITLFCLSSTFAAFMQEIK